MAGVRRLLRRPVRRVREDLAADPYLPYLLALAAATCGFGIWFRVPNFAAPDEYSRLIQPMKVAGAFVSDPGIDSVRRALTDGRALGATFYLYSLTLVPTFLAVVLTGRLGQFAGLGTIESRWTLWHAAPAWFWTASILSARLVSVLLGVACVYLTYRLGTELRDRFAGRVAALSLALSVGFLSQAHLVGEDLPMLFLLLVTVLLADRYVRTGRAEHFLLGSLTGGLAIAFKLSGGAGAVVLGVAYLARAARSDDLWSELARPRVVVGGLAAGAVAVSLGIPSVLVGGPDELLVRMTGSIESKTTRSGGIDAPIWYWILRHYVGGFGPALAAAAAVGTLAGVRHLLDRRTRPADPLAVLLFAALATYFLVYSRWEFVRMRHLVPTFPVLLAFLGATASRWRERGDRRRAVRAGLAFVLVTSALFAGVAEYQYVTDPRDRATRWIATNTEENATMEVYENSIADVATPHGRETVHYDFPEENATNTSDLVLNESDYTAWMLGLPERRPDYVQLTAAELSYLEPTNPASREYPERRRHVRRLLDGEYEYAVAAEFGTRRRPDTLLGDLVRVALVPDAEGREEYVVILRRRR